MQSISNKKYRDQKERGREREREGIEERERYLILPVNEFLRVFQHFDAPFDLNEKSNKNAITGTPEDLLT